MPLTDDQLAAAFRADPGLRKKFEGIVAARSRTFDGDTHPFYTFEPQPYQLKVLRGKKPVIGFCAANQVGKSTIGAFWIASRLMGFDPTNGNKEFPGPGRYWACTKGDLIDGLKRKVMEFLPPHEIKKELNGYGRQYIEMKNGRWVKFKSYDQPRSAFQQESLNDLWNDEEPPREIWTEQKTRLLRFGGQMLLSFTPVEGSIWMHEVLFEEGADKVVDFVKAGMRDNKYLKTEHIEAYIRDFRDDPDQLAIRVNGDYRLMSGADIFDQEQLEAYWKKTVDPQRLVYFDEEGAAQTVDDVNVRPYHLSVWRPPETGHRYAIGGDVAAGLAKGDWSVAYVGDVDRNELVARFRGKIDSYDYADELAAMGYWYNTAKIGVETNFGSTADRLFKLDYPNLFRRLRFTGATRSTTNNIGWLTNAPSKEHMVGDFRAAFMDGMIAFHDAKLIDEMRRFRWLAKDQPGKHGCGAITGNDDCAIAAMITLQVMNSVDEPSQRVGLSYDERLVTKIEEAAEKGYEEEENEAPWD